MGDGIAPRQDLRIVSQIDMAPTLLSLMGISADYPMLGKDLTRMPADWPGRAIMQYDKNFALMRGKDVVILQPGGRRKASSMRMRQRRSPRRRNRPP